MFRYCKDRIHVCTGTILSEYLYAKVLFFARVACLTITLSTTTLQDEVNLTRRNSLSCRQALLPNALLKDSR